MLQLNISNMEWSWNLFVYGRCSHIYVTFFTQISVAYIF
jgi:GTP cyclohydrolase I